MDAEQEKLIEDFKLAMRRLAVTPTIVSTASRGQRFGMAATSVTSLSMEPPSLLVCINRNASIYPELEINSAFCVNILQSGHEEVCMAFGGAVEAAERFQAHLWDEDKKCAPYLLDAGANVFCTVSRMLNHGSHSIIIGDVYQCNVAGTKAPLIYGDGGFLRAC